MTTITQVITTLPDGPDPATDTPDSFTTKAAARVLAEETWVTEMNTWRTQANALAAGLNAIATGSALSIPLTFSTTTTDSDPGNGIVRLDNATQNAATTIRTDLIGNDGSTWTDVINLFDDSTSTIKGFITLVDLTDATKWLAFSVSAVASPSGYKNITVANVASSTANPFANGASLALKFTRTGDKGDTGAAGAGITPQATGFTLTGGTTPKTLTQDVDLTASAVVTLTGTQTLTNKRGTKRVVSYTANGAAPSINTDITDTFAITSQTIAITGIVTTGTPVAGDELFVDITSTDTGIVFAAANFESSGTITLPTAVTSGVMKTCGFRWNTATSKWRIVGIS